jgi:hypothetical protein
MPWLRKLLKLKLLMDNVMLLLSAQVIKMLPIKLEHLKVLQLLINSLLLIILMILFQVCLVER